LTDRDPPCVAVLGVGEAGSEIAGDLLAAGAAVRVYDPADVPTPDGATRCTDEAHAATGADVVLSVNSATAAWSAFERGHAGLSADAIWADLNTSAASLKRRLAAAALPDVAFADVAVMAPVPGRGLHTPMLASGPAAAGFAQLLEPLGADVTVLDAPAGEAAQRKLLRSVFFKGMAAAVVEALAAARAADREDWLRDNIAAELAAADANTVTRLDEGSRKHARRRAEEMRAAAEMLDELGVPAHVAQASVQWLESLRDAPDRWS
jgi:3-hydroxyisobutyrate dehydrogenase-like beta-hydroxyacid dehydrogenase